jgi:hypothetical protein
MDAVVYDQAYYLFPGRKPIARTKDLSARRGFGRLGVLGCCVTLLWALT